MEKKLTPKRAKFMAEYIKTGHVTNSAIKAGYSKKTAYSIGSEILNKPEIKAKIEAIMSTEAEKLGINAEFVLGNLKYFASKKKDKASSAAIKANELLGKHLKLFHDTEVDVKMRHQQWIEEMEKLE